MKEGEQSSQDVARALIEDLVDEGEHVDDGGFTLDPAVALAKLRAHQLDDPHAYLLLLIEAAWLAGHGRSEGGVRITLGASTTVTFRGLALEHMALPDMFMVALVGDVEALEDQARTRAKILQLIGLAANAALALAPKRLVITATDAQGRATRVEVTSAGALTIEEPTDERLRAGSVRFSLDGVGRGKKRNQAELALVRQRCRHTTLPVWVDGKQVSYGPTVGLRSNAAEPHALVLTEVRYRGEVIGVAGYRANLGASPQVVFVNRGVAIVEPLRDQHGPGVQAVVEVDLPVDLSRKQLVEGAELEAIRAGIRAAITRLVAEHSPEATPPIAVTPGVVLAGAVVVIIVIVGFSTAGGSDRSKPTRDDVMRQEIERMAAQTRAISKDIEQSALEIGCFGSTEGKTCALAAEGARSSITRDHLLLRGCTVHHEPDACQALVAAAQLHAREHMDLAPVGLALVESCLGVAGPDCVEAARYLQRGDYPSDARRFDNYYLLHHPIPDIGEDELLARGCEAGVAEACR